MRFQQLLLIGAGFFVAAPSLNAQVWEYPAGTAQFSGKVGIGTQPSAMLDVYNPNGPANTVGAEVEFAKLNGSTTQNLSSFRFINKRHTVNGGWVSVSSKLQFTTDVSDQGYIEFNPKNAPWGMALGTDHIEIMILRSNGSVGIGTSQINDANYKLFVETGIRTRKVKVDVAQWPDYVFHAGYRLRPLSEVGEYIRQHQHLPELPSAAEVEKEGVNLGENQATLFKKIEELTLYLIEQNKKLEDQGKKLEQQQQEIIQLKEQVQQRK